MIDPVPRVPGETTGRGNPTYAALRQDGKANSLVRRALELSGILPGRALDIGAGPLNDTRLLLRRGFSVDAIDRDPDFPALVAALDEPRLRAFCGDIRELTIARGSYDLVVAIHVLPFLARGELDAHMSSIADGLAPGGILCCTLFGTNDGWAACRPRMTFLTRADVEALLRPLEPVLLSELEYDGVDANGRPKRWHAFRCITRKG